MKQVVASVIIVIILVTIIAIMSAALNEPYEVMAIHFLVGMIAALIARDITKEAR